MEQRTDEWFSARLGKVTASRMADVTAKTRNGWGASRANYKSELVCERLTGKPTQSFISAPMQWGIDTEPQARAAYEWLRDATVVEEVGFVPHPTIEMTGASPDGLVGDDGMLEIKCPNTNTHLDLLLTNKIPDKHIKQMQWQMACAGRAWCDYASFDPRLPNEMQLHVIRIKRDDEMIAELEEAVVEFLAEVDETVAQLSRQVWRMK